MPGQTIAIQVLTKGQAPTLLDTEKANELITAINALLSMEVQPQGAGKLVSSKGKVQLDLRGGGLVSAENLEIRPPEFGEVVQEGDKVVIDLTNLQKIIDWMVNRMNNATAEAHCTASGGIEANILI